MTAPLRCVLIIDWPVQIHNFGRSFDDDSPNLEFVAPCSVYVVVNGERTNLDLSAIPVSFTLTRIYRLQRATTGYKCLLHFTRIMFLCSDEQCTLSARVRVSNI